VSVAYLLLQIPPPQGKEHHEIRHKVGQEIEITLGIRGGHAFRHVPAHHGVRTDGTDKADKAVTPYPTVSSDSAWRHPVLATTASKGEGVEELVTKLDEHHEWLVRTGVLAERRRRRLAERTREVVNRATRHWIWQETQAEQAILDRLDEVTAGRLSPYELAAEILESLKQGARL